MSRSAELVGNGIDRATPADVYDITKPDAVQTRFGIDAIRIDEDAATTAVSMSISHMRNPSTGLPTIAPLALLVDVAGSIANFARRRGQWPVTTELAIEYRPDGPAQVMSSDATPVIAEAHVIEATPAESLASCILMLAGAQVATATVRSVFVSGDGVLPGYPDETLMKTPTTSLGELLAVRPRKPEGTTHTLDQLPDPMVLNGMGTVHGGSAATALELVAHASVADSEGLRRYRTGSLRVNFLRPLTPGLRCRYVATAVKVGSSVAVADARAEGDDGATAVIARLTAYADREE